MEVGRVVGKDGGRQMLELASFTSFGGPVSSVPSTSSGSTPVVKQQQRSGTDPSAFVSTLSHFLLAQTLPFPPPPF